MQRSDWSQAAAPGSSSLAPGILAWPIFLVASASALPDASRRRSCGALPSGPAQPAGPNILILIGDDHAGRHPRRPRATHTTRDAEDRRPGAGRASRFRPGLLQLAALHAEPAVAHHREAAARRRRDPALDHSAAGRRRSTLGDWLGDLGYSTRRLSARCTSTPASKHGFDLQDRHPPVGGDMARRASRPPRGGNRVVPWRPLHDPAAVVAQLAANRPYGLPDARRWRRPSSSTDRLDAFLERHRDRSRTSPFAMVMGFYEPHSPFKYPDDWPRRFSARRLRPRSDALSDARPPATGRPSSRDITIPNRRQGASRRPISRRWLVRRFAQVGRRRSTRSTPAGSPTSTIVVYLGGQRLSSRPARPVRKALLRTSRPCKVPLIIRWPGHLPAGPGGGRQGGAGRPAPDPPATSRAGLDAPRPGCTAGA